MAIKRAWRGRPRALSEVPDAIKNAPEYAAHPSDDKFIDEVRQSMNGLWFRLTFDDGAVDYWRFVDGHWKYSQQSPTPADLVAADGVTGGE